MEVLRIGVDGCSNGCRDSVNVRGEAKTEGLVPDFVVGMTEEPPVADTANLSPGEPVRSRGDLVGDSDILARLGGGSVMRNARRCRSD
jgi:hypothetical protein